MKTLREIGFMKINFKYYDPVFMILSFLTPILGFIYWFYSLTKSLRNIDIFFVSVFFAIVVYCMPPMNDLYRHYLVYEYGDYISLKDINEISLLLVYINNNILVFFKKNSIHFNLIASIYVFTSVFIMLAVKKNVIETFNIPRNCFFLVFFSTICLYQLFFLASGLRYGVATYIAFLASYLFLIKSISFSRFSLISFVAVLFHPAVFLIPFIVIFSKLFKINKSSFIFIFICSFFIGGVFPEIVSELFNLIGAANYAFAYADEGGDYGSLSGKNINGLIAFLFNFIPLIFLSLHIFLRKNERSKEILIFCLWGLIFLMLFRNIPVLLSRVAISISGFFLISYIINIKEKLFIINTVFYKSIFYFVFILYFIVINIYIERRVLVYGEIWKSLYNPLFFNIFNYHDNFDKFLLEIGDDGAWIKDNAQAEAP